MTTAAEIEAIREHDRGLGDNVMTIGSRDRRCLLAALDAVTAERDQARAAILSFGGGNDFDWNVLDKINRIERFADAVRAADKVTSVDAAAVEACQALVGWRDVASPENFVRMVKAADVLVELGWTDGSGA